MGAGTLYKSFVLRAIGREGFEELVERDPLSDTSALLALGADV